MKKWCQMILVVSVFLLASGCKTQDKNVSKGQTEFQRIAWEDSLLELAPGGAFSVTESGDFFCVEDYGNICRYSADGTLLNIYEGCGDISAICLNGCNLFYYTYEDELKCLSVENGKMTTVTEGLWFTEVTNLVTAGDYLYLYGITNESGQEEVVVKKINPKNGKVKKIESEAGIRAIYGSSDGILYYCTEASGGTYLYSYHGDSEESTKLYDLTNRPESEYPIQAFICEKGLILYTTFSNSMTVMSLKQEKAKIIPMKGILTRGKDLVCVAGNVVYQTFSQETMSMHRERLYFGDIVLEPMEEALRDSITVWDIYADHLDAKRIAADSGIQTKYIVGEIGTEAFLTEMMAGNPNVDIYVLSMSAKEAQLIKDKGIFISLNSSEVIKEYRDSCFSYIAEGMTTDSGDIWMLPVGIDSSAIWYVEDNLEQFQIQTEQFYTMEKFTELAKEMKERLKGSEYRTYVTPMIIGNDWIEQYDSMYCDFVKGDANYVTDVYKNLYRTLWSGWKVYGQDAGHPYFTSWMKEDEEYGLLANHPCYNSERVVYKYSLMSEHLKYGDLHEWRVSPAPVISEEIQGNKVTITGLIINPYSSKKDLAMQYLETIAENPLGIYGGAYMTTTSFLFEDVDSYEGFYDTSLQATKDMYEIFMDGRVGVASYPYYFSIVNDYQEGRLTLDEALARLQRDTEMWLNE